MGGNELVKTRRRVLGHLFEPSANLTTNSLASIFQELIVAELFAGGSQAQVICIPNETNEIRPLWNDSFAGPRHQHLLCIYRVVGAGERIRTLRNNRDTFDSSGGNIDGDNVHP